MKERLDVLLVNRGLAPSREKAKTMIMEGNVFVNNNREDDGGNLSEGGIADEAIEHFGQLLGLKRPDRIILRRNIHRLYFLCVVDDREG